MKRGAVEIGDARELARLLARGYLRLLAARAAVPATTPLPGNPAKRVDSLRPKSVNWVEHEGGAHFGEGGRDA